MKTSNKQLMIAGASLAVVVSTIAGVGLAKAATASTTTKADHQAALITKLATGTGKSESDIKAIFDADHAARQVEHEATEAADLAQAVTDKKLTQAQADHLTAIDKEIDTLRNGKRPAELDQTTKDAIKTKRGALKTWATEQKLDLSTFMHGSGDGRRGHHGGDKNNNDSGN